MVSRATLYRYISIYHDVGYQVGGLLQVKGIVKEDAMRQGCQPTQLDGTQW
jgi:hypothetical protein